MTIQNNSLRDNIISLFVLQGVNYVLPLMTVPYLVRTLGPEKFGLLAFSQAFILYFVLLTDYGFNLSATRLISVHRYDLVRRSKIFWSTVWTKVGLMVVSLLVVTVIVFCVPKLREEWPLYIFTFLMVVGNVLSPVWYFQGMERIKIISILNIFSNIITFLAIFLLVHQESDYIIAAAVQGSSLIIGGLLGVFFIPRVGPVRFLWPNPALIREALKEGWHVFISTAGVSLYASSSVFLLGLLAGNTVVGYFSAAEKLVKAVQGLISPVSQAIYPRINSLAAHSREEALEFIRKTLNWVGAGSLIMSLALFILAKPIVLLILGPKYEYTIILVRWMAFTPFIVALSNVFGVQTMLTFGMKKQFSRILVLSGVANLLFLVPLIYLAESKGAAISLLVTECLVTLSMALVLRKNGLYIYRHRTELAKT